MGEPIIDHAIRRRNRSRLRIEPPGLRPLLLSNLLRRRQFHQPGAPFRRRHQQPPPPPPLPQPNAKLQRALHQLLRLTRLRRRRVSVLTPAAAAAAGLNADARTGRLDPLRGGSQKRADGRRIRVQHRVQQQNRPQPRRPDLLRLIRRRLREPPLPTVEDPRTRFGQLAQVPSRRVQRRFDPREALPPPPQGVRVPLQGRHCHRRRAHSALLPAMQQIPSPVGIRQRQAQLPQTPRRPQPPPAKIAANKSRLRSQVRDLRRRPHFRKPSKVAARFRPQFVFCDGGDLTAANITRLLPPPLLHRWHNLIHGVDELTLLFQRVNSGEIKTPISNECRTS